MSFHSLLNHEYLFYGVDNYTFKIDDYVYEVVEDPDDGYRSCLGTIERTDNINGIFFREPIAIVTIEEEKEAYCDGYKLTEDDGHIWLRFGTDNSDGYYPLFYFNYTPKPQPKIKQNPSSQSTDFNSFDRLFNPREG